MDTDYLALHRPVPYSEEAKSDFHRVAKKLLARLAKKLDGRGYGERSPIRSNMGGIAVSGEITLHYDRLYVQVMQSALGTEHGIMFRSCHSQQDYTGGYNHFAPLRDLTETDQLAKLILQVVRPPL